MAEKQRLAAHRVDFAGHQRGFGHFAFGRSVFGHAIGHAQPRIAHLPKHHPQQIAKPENLFRRPKRVGWCHQHVYRGEANTGQ